MAQKGLWNIVKRRMLEDRENFLSSWLRKNVEGVEEERERLNDEAKQEERKVGKERWRENGKGLRSTDFVWIVHLAKFRGVLSRF